MDLRVNSRPVDILLVEDNIADVRLAQEAFKEGNVTKTLHVARDGEEALAFLRREGSHANAPRPDLILLDLNLPRKDGREVLREIKGDESLRMIPVIVLTTSQAEEDISHTYDLAANCYVPKPVDFDRFTRVIRTIENFWLTVVQIPPK
jgi:chemotaxis family two-component system response regulator Rcp1